MNIERGLKRISYVLFGLISLIVLLLAAQEGAAQMGQAVAYLLIGFVVYMVLFKITSVSLRWIWRGFKQDDPKA